MADESQCRIKIRIDLNFTKLECSLSFCLDFYIAANNVWDINNIHCCTCLSTLYRINPSAEHYVVKIACLGEDGDEGFVAFTHDRRRAVAALHRYIRVDLKDGPVKKITSGKTGWWLVFDNCGCGDTCPHPEDEDGEIECNDCEHYGLPPCIEDRLPWLGETQAEAVEGSVPVMEFEVDY